MILPKMKRRNHMPTQYKIEAYLSALWVAKLTILTFGAAVFLVFA